jgi:hypothetical protein
MKICLRRFNTYFAAILFAGGCMSEPHSKPDKHKEQSTIRLYMEGSRTDYSSVGTVLVTREKIPFTVGREPFLTEADLKRARLIDDPSQDGSYFIELAFNEHGTLLLDMMTTDNKGRHIVVFSQFPPPGQKQPKVKKKNKDSDSEDDFDEQHPAPVPAPPPDEPGKPRQSAWLTAVLIRDRNPSGVFRFTPDATRAEAARIVRGLKNDIAEAKKLDKFNL